METQTKKESMSLITLMNMYDDGDISEEQYNVYLSIELDIPFEDDPGQFIDTKNDW